MTDEELITKAWANCGADMTREEFRRLIALARVGLVAKADKADGWDEGFNEGIGRDPDFYDLRHLNPYRSKTDD